MPETVVHAAMMAHTVSVAIKGNAAAIDNPARLKYNGHIEIVVIARKNIRQAFRGFAQ